MEPNFVQNDKNGTECTETGWRHQTSSVPLYGPPKNLTLRAQRRGRFKEEAAKLALIKNFPSPQPEV